MYSSQFYFIFYREAIIKTVCIFKPFLINKKKNGGTFALHSFRNNLLHSLHAAFLTAHVFTLE